MSCSPLRLAPSSKKTRHECTGLKLNDLPPTCIQLLSQSLIEFSEWRLKRASDLFWRLYIPLSEGAHIKFGKASIPLRPGFLYLISPRTTLVTNNEKPFQMWVIHFQVGEISALARSTPLQAQDTVSEIQVSDDLYRLTQEACPTEAIPDSQSQQTQFVSVLELILRTLRTKAHQIWSIQIRDNRVPALLELIRENIDKADILEVLRNSAGFNRLQLYRLFVAETGYPPIHFVIEIRLDQATHLLRHTTLSPASIAEMTGFGDAIHMKRMFKKHRGLSSADIRRQAFQ